MGRVGLIPHRLVYSIVLETLFECGGGRIDGVLQVCALDYLEFGLPVILDFRGGGLAVDGRGLGDMGFGHRFFGLGGTSHAHQDVAPGRVGGDFTEIGGKLGRRHVGPGAVGEGWGFEPAPRYEDVSLPRGRVQENRALGVSHEE